MIRFPQVKFVLFQFVSGKVSGEMNKVIGEFAVPLETRFCEVRCKETNMGMEIDMI